MTEEDYEIPNDDSFAESSSSSKEFGREKPRRLEDDLADYLIRLDFSRIESLEDNRVKKTQKHEEDSNTLDPKEETEVFVANVLEELKLRTASAASDRRTNFIIEKMCVFANLSQLIEIIQRSAPYILFLARNRYSSHVLQVMEDVLSLFLLDF